MYNSVIDQQPEYFQVVVFFMKLSIYMLGKQSYHNVLTKKNPPVYRGFHVVCQTTKVPCANPTYFN